MHIHHDYTLAPFTTFHIGGKAKLYIKVSSVRDVSSAYTHARDSGLPIRILGGGSNLLIPEEIEPVAVIHVDIKGVVLDEVHKSVHIGAGESLDDSVVYTSTKGFNAFARLAGIPGTVGGAIVQNAGAYGREIKDIVQSVDVFDTKTGEARTLSNQECLFVYRDSIFKTNHNLIITGATCRLHTSEPEREYPDITDWIVQHGNLDTPEDLSKAIREIRRHKLPDWHTVGTAGSFFKNPIIYVKHYQHLKDLYPDLPGFQISSDEKDQDKTLFKVPLAWILDHICKLKGYTHGTAEVYDKQALVIVSKSPHIYADVIALAKHMKDTVKRMTDIDVDSEVVHW